PTEYRMRETPKSLASLIQLTDRLLAVDATLKEIIETLEPGVHQFWPIRMPMPRGKDYPVPYYAMIIGRFIDSFVPEQSEFNQTSRGSNSFFANGPTKK